MKRMCKTNHDHNNSSQSQYLSCTYLGTVDTDGLIEIEGFSDGKKLGETEVEGLSEGCSESVGCSLGDVDIDG